MQEIHIEKMTSTGLLHNVEILDVIHIESNLVVTYIELNHIDPSVLAHRTHGVGSKLELLDPLVN